MRTIIRENKSFMKKKKKHFWQKKNFFIKQPSRLNGQPCLSDQKSSPLGANFQTQQILLKINVFSFFYFIIKTISTVDCPQCIQW